MTTATPRLFFPTRRDGLVALLLGGLLLVAFGPTLVEMGRVWLERSEYGHGLLMPPVAAWMIWERRHKLAALRARPGLRESWFALLAAFALLPLCALLVLGEMKFSWFLKPFAFVGALAACIGVRYGWQGLRALLTPLIVLLLMCPLPYRVMMWATIPLKRYATVLATGLMDLSGLNVGLHGNMINVPGIDSLWIADACSGLRSSVSLVSIAIIACLFWRRHWSIKLVVVASCVPIAIVVNSLRIWLTAMLSVHVSPEAAQGFFHEFEGFVLFGFAAVCAFGWAWLLHLILPRRASVPAAKPPRRPVSPLSGGRAVRTAAILVALLALGAGAAMGARIRSRLGGERVDAGAAARMQAEFTRLPREIPDSDYRGRPVEWDAKTIRNSGADAYGSMLYEGKDGRTYQVYFGGALRNNDNFHTPNVCMPAAGWEMLSQTKVPFDAYPVDRKNPRMQRMLLQRGTRQMLVYFWFQAGTRLAEDEWTVRYYRLLDILHGSRLSPTLIVSLYVPIAGGVEETDRAAHEFLDSIGPNLREVTTSGGIHG